MLTYKIYGANHVKKSISLELNSECEGVVESRSNYILEVMCD